VEFRPQPTVAEPIRTLGQVEALRLPDPRESVPYVFEILRILRRELEAEAVPLLGFSGAPFTLASYLVEGGTSKDFSTLKRMLYREPAVLRALLARLAEMVVDYLNAQIEAGAQVVQLFDTWAGILAPDEYRSLDWRVDMARAARLAGRHASLQGNLDPCALAAPPEQIFARVREIAEAAAPARGHILNLGHGCLPETPVEGVRAFTDAARALAGNSE
jgi:uroporphyrinogen decarboxylase